MDYTEYIIKEYKYWILFLHANQYPYIGRCYAWAKRENASLVTDMKKEERDELFDLIIPKWSKTVKKLFEADWINASILGNTAPHVHWHLIPRYHSSRRFFNIDFIDPRPKHNYSPYEKRDIPKETLTNIKDLIKSEY